MPVKSVLPTLEHLNSALQSRLLGELVQLRKQLDWKPDESTDRIGAVGTSDASYNHLCAVLRTFGVHSLDCTDKLGDTLVHATAAACTDAAALQLILETTGSPHCFNRRGDKKFAAVHCAAANPNGDAAFRWLVRQLGVSCLEDADTLNTLTPVHIAARSQGAGTMDFLESQLGAACFQWRAAGSDRTAFHFAAMNESGDEALVWLMDKIGCRPLTDRDGLGHTPVHLAALVQGEATMSLLLHKLGCQMYALKGQDDESVVHSAARNSRTNSALKWCMGKLGPDCALIPDALDRVPLHYAAQCQNDEECLLLAVQSLGVKCLTLTGELQRNAVHHAALNTRSNSALRWIVGQLGPACLTVRDAEGNMPLHLAAQRQGVDSLQLVKAVLGDAAFKLEGANKRRILHYAAENETHRKLLLDWMSREILPVDTSSTLAC